MFDDFVVEFDAHDIAGLGHGEEHGAGEVRFEGESGGLIDEGDPDELGGGGNEGSEGAVHRRATVDEQ